MLIDILMFGFLARKPMVLGGFEGFDYVIDRVVLTGFAVEPPKTEQSDAQNSVFRNSAGL
jgi:hypothetical protein